MSLRDKPGNIVLLILAVCVIADFFIVLPNDEGDFLISIGLFGALLSRAFLQEAQSVVVSLLGLALTIEIVCRNHGIIDRSSDGWYVLGLLIAAVYALWEKILRWFSI